MTDEDAGYRDFVRKLQTLKDEFGHRPIPDATDVRMITVLHTYDAITIALELSDHGFRDVAVRGTSVYFRPPNWFRRVLNRLLDRLLGQRGISVGPD
jgi:hypothetical protein